MNPSAETHVHSGPLLPTPSQKEKNKGFSEKKIGFPLEYRPAEYKHTIGLERGRVQSRNIPEKAITSLHHVIYKYRSG